MNVVILKGKPHAVYFKNGREIEQNILMTFVGKSLLYKFSLYVGFELSTFFK